MDRCETCSLENCWCDRFTGCKQCQCHDCVCWVIDPWVRMSPKAQISAHLEAEYMYSDQPDECWDWYVYLRSIGFTEEQVYGHSRPQFDDEVLRVCPEGVEYSCILNVT